MLRDTTVVDTLPLDWECATGTGCAQDWYAVGTFGYNGVLWHNVSTGVLGVWQTGDRNHVKGSYNLSSGCDSTCAQKWKIIGQVDFDGKAGPDLAWHNIDTGEVSIWLTDPAGTVTSTATLDWKCDSTCTQTWKPLGFVQFPDPPPH
ncbi:hypothetical protein LVJ94_43515 [Pendulispora rubella]|uniref:Uncharacterized protein n=1 Tax=Pendulispora rubella TaxID=2741070 RepID=A0ABZ2L583_9BACT